MEADLKRIDAMEEDQEVTSRLQAEFTMGELPSLAVPASVIPSNSRFLSYENMKKSFTYSPEVMQHPWVKGALAVTGSSVKKLWTSNNEPISLRRRTYPEGHHCQEDHNTNREEGDIITWVWALPLETAKLGGDAPVSYHHHILIFTFFLVRSF